MNTSIRSRSHSRASRTVHTNIAYSIALRAALTVIYVILLHLCYIDMIAPTFAYLGFTYRTPIQTSYVAAIALASILTCFMPKRVDRPSVAILWMHYLIATLPSIIIPHYTEAVSPEKAIGLSLGVAAAWTSVLILNSDKCRLRMPRPNFSIPGIWNWLIPCFSISVNLLIFIALDMRPQLAMFTEISNVRMNYRETLQTSSPLAAYIILGAGNVLNPALIAIGWLKRAWTQFAIGIVGQIAIYSVTGYKTIALSAIAVTVWCVWIRRRSAVNSPPILIAFVGLMTASWLALKVFGSTFLIFIFVFRFMASPGNLFAAYVSVFEDLPPLKWSYTFMSWAFDYPYSTQPNFLVGELYRGDAETSANVNMFGDGFMNFGWPGVVIECLVFCVVLWLIDSAAKGIPLALSISIVTIPTIALANSSIFTALLTHGFVLAYLILVLYPRHILATEYHGQDAPQSKGQRHAYSRNV